MSTIYQLNSKTRRHSGRYIPVIYDPINLPYEETKWDDWTDYRDGFRNLKDRSLLRTSYSWLSEIFHVKEDNKKNKLLIRRRLARKSGGFFR